MRRAEGAFREHIRAREATNTFLTVDRQSPSFYADALLHWEFCLSQSWQAYALLRSLIRMMYDDPKWQVFEQGDGSVEQGLHMLYNAMKHVESRIESGQMLDESTGSPVWLSNNGVECTDATLTYAETGEILTDVAKWADILIDPVDTPNKLRRAFADGAE